MGSSNSRGKTNSLVIPPYNPPPTGTGTGARTGISKPGAPNQQGSLGNQNNRFNGPGGGNYPGQNMPYGFYPPYGMPPMFGQQNMYGPMGQGGYMPMRRPEPAPAVYRDTDFAALASIAGLTTADVSLLHREFLNLTYGGTTKMDRAIFRDLLRDVLFELNNENVDRAIENVFVSVDRNRDGYLDFPEFVGAFKDVLRGGVSDAEFYNAGQNYSDLLADQIRLVGIGSGVVSQPIQYATADQPTMAAQVIPIASVGIEPTIAIDAQPSAYFIATPGQYLITQPTALQITPLATM